MSTDSNATELDDFCELANAIAFSKGGPDSYDWLDERAKRGIELIRKLAGTDALTALIDERIQRDKKDVPQPPSEPSFQEQCADRGNTYTGVDRRSLGQVAYEAWESVYEGGGNPVWNEESENIHACWQAAAEAVVKANNERSASTGPAIAMIAVNRLLDRAENVIRRSMSGEDNAGHFDWLTDYEAWKAARK